MGKKEKELEDSLSEISYIEPRAFTRDEVIVCGTYGKIYAIHKRDGTQLWGVKFPTGCWKSLVSVFITDNDKVIVGARGKIACLSLFTGETLWANTMKKCGYEVVSVISTFSRSLQPLANQDPTDEIPQDEHPPQYDDVEKQYNNLIITCTYGKCLAMDPVSGQEVWRFNCPKGGRNQPVAIVEPPSAEMGKRQRIYIGNGKYVYCLDAASGKQEWISKVTNAIFGDDYLTLATPWSSRLAAETHSSYCQMPSAQARQIEDDDN